MFESNAISYEYQTNVDKGSYDIRFESNAISYEYQTIIGFGIVDGGLRVMQYLMNIKLEKCKVICKVCLKVMQYLMNIK